MEYRQIQSDMKAGKLAPVYFFFGLESYPIEHLIREIIEQSVDPASRDFDCDILQGEEVDVDTIIGVASSYPMISQHRVVIVKSLEKLTLNDRKKILTVVENPLKSTVLVLVAGKINRNQSHYTSIIKHSQWMECKPLYENQAVEWVKNSMKTKGITLTHEGATFLVQQVGTSLWILHHEIEKLMTFTWKKKSLGMEDILSIVGSSRKFNTWEFTDSVASKDFPKALSILNHFLEIRYSPVGLIMNLTQRIQQLLRIKALIQDGATEKTISFQLGLSPYFSRLFIIQARKFSTTELEFNINTLLTADYSIKSGLLDPKIVLTLMLYDVFAGESKYRFFH